MFNYLNDAHHYSDMGVLWPTQLFFSLTDLLPAYTQHILLARGSTLPNTVLRCSLVVSVTHVFLALWDQGATHILTAHALAGRDVMFLLSDVAGVLAVAPFTDMKAGEGLRKMGMGGGGLGLFYLGLKWCVNSR